MEMKNISIEELTMRVEKNYARLCEPYYQIQEVFSDSSYDWPGDKEGRALLAFVSHFRISGRKIPCMELMIEALPEKTNLYYFFGNEAGEVIDEQQLSSHNWYLRGLLEYYEQFHDERVLVYAKSTVEHLYYPTMGRFPTYPVNRLESGGGVSGNRGYIQDGWCLSTDVGCAFMSIDGLAHYYQIVQDKKVLSLLDEMRDVFDKIDKMEIQAQTHCCLTAARGFLRLYQVTSEQKYFDSAKKVIDLYIEKGMTYTYQNFNWWNRGDTWTEPCAVVDSLMAITELFKLTKDEYYRTIATRIWHNGFSTLQVGNGGAGTTTTVSDTEAVLRTDMYEAYFCCTMRLTEGLRYVWENRELLYATCGPIAKDSYGRYMGGDILYAEVFFDEKYSHMIRQNGQIEYDGLVLQPIVKYYNLPKEVTDTIRQRIIF